MKNVVFLALVAGLLSAQGVNAAVQVVDKNDDVQISAWGPMTYGAGGGPFKVTVWHDADTGTATRTGETTTLLSFCVQTDQQFNWNGYYNVADTLVKTKEGNVTRELSGYAMWVYQTFEGLKGISAGVTSLSGTGISVANLEDYQRAIWAGVITGTNDPLVKDYIGASNSLYTIGATDTRRTQWLVGSGENQRDISLAAFNNKINSAVNPFGDPSVVWAYDMDAANNGRVPYEMIVLTNSQDQVISATGTLTSVPEPASIAIWSLIGGLGVAGAAMKRRKSQNGRWSDENRQAILSIVDTRA